MLKHKELIDIMFSSFGCGDDKQTKDAYLYRLESVELEQLNQRISWLIDNFTPEYGKKIPSIADILGHDKNAQVGELEEAWKEFKRTMCNNLRFEIIPDWVYTIKRRMGEKRVEDMLESEEHWFKAEFEKIYLAVKSKHIALESDPMANKYLTVDGNNYLLPDKLDNNRFCLNNNLLKERRIKINYVDNY